MKEREMNYWREIRHRGGMSSVCVRFFVCLYLRIRGMNWVAGSSWHCSLISSCHEFESHNICRPDGVSTLYTAWVQGFKGFNDLCLPFPIILVLLSPPQSKSLEMQPSSLYLLAWRCQTRHMDSVAIWSEAVVSDVSWHDWLPVPCFPQDTASSPAQDCL